jgi:N,N'-diacetyllegionaminate synthase
MTGFDIGPKHVGDGAPCLIVAEVAQAHEGSVRIAHAYIDAVADAGADAVKFQCHIAAAESTPDEPWRVDPGWPQDASRYAYWQRMQFTDLQWATLAIHAEKRGPIFLCSPFSVEAVKLLDPLVPAWKVASGEIGNVRLFEAIRATAKPVIFSTGMSTWGEVCVASGRLRAKQAWLHCVSKYPCPAESVGLNVLTEWLEAPVHPVGLSDHSGTIWPSIAAVTLGASIVEVHVKLSKHDQGFDASSSITVEELRQLVEGVRFIEKAKQPVDKDALAKELEPMRRLFMDRHKRHAKAAIDACESGADWIRHGEECMG